MEHSKLNADPTREAQVEKYNDVAVAVTLDTNILTTGLTPQIEPCRFIVSVCPVLAGVLSVMRTHGGVERQEILNAGEDLIAGTLDEFDFEVKDGDSINFQYSVTTTFNCFSVVEV